MPTLIVLRHAKSDQHLGLPDAERPLNDRGRRQAPDVGRWLNGHAPRLDVAVVSSAVRTRETWQLVSAALDQPPPVSFDPKVYNASLGDLLEVVRELPDEASTALLVGHNPGVSELVHELTGEPVEMSTAAAVVIELTGEWSSAGPQTGRLIRAHRV